MLLMTQMQKGHNDALEVLKGRIIFLENQIEPYRVELQEMQELKAALQAKKEENDELSAAFEELERERNTVVEDVREEMLHYLAQVQAELRHEKEEHGKSRVSLSAARSEIRNLTSWLNEAQKEMSKLFKLTKVQHEVIQSLERGNPDKLAFPHCGGELLAGAGEYGAEALSPPAEDRSRKQGAGPLPLQHELPARPETRLRRAPHPQHHSLPQRDGTTLPPRAHRPPVLDDHTLPPAGWRVDAAVPHPAAAAHGDALQDLGDQQEAHRGGSQLLLEVPLQPDLIRARGMGLTMADQETLCKRKE
ncbi:hypothetical protein GUITHDRAFT_118724 [Guillardia theta CCMP2712]|uniref:Uncharacterized protein n=1 Tax=Guillardia theta (strain CCMP2712) TaxID=905079 RepID=L1IGL8_GUITC|nr:hypothetical protein GUITHDRAFT_118724 [Guillardia theta CCMP2712]EKX35069.1 hypothetical protein GUITHDRAFT_118724 [Guillardia theta CCMP2712]|eukprot:XP_005822049.1 hypothetical protein GUITHDRAFT_118724 [Guillardia theta CCMP2712]